LNNQLANGITITGNGTGNLKKSNDHSANGEKSAKRTVSPVVVTARPNFSS
jgi:hypothetical protein